MRICFLMEPPRSKTSVTYDIINGLKAGGADVEILTESSGMVDLRQVRFDYDLYLFKSHSPFAESLAAAAHYHGGKLINEYPATMKVRDKILTCTLLLQAGIPTPRTFITDSVETLRSVVREMPVIIKPFRGRRGQGIEICMNEADFDAYLTRHNTESSAQAGDGGEDGSSLGERLIFAQEYEEHDAYDYKAYAVGDYIHSIKRIFPASTREEKEGTPVSNDPELTYLVQKCGKLFGLELFGVDLVKTDRGYSVIEVNCFPGYKGVPQAGERISQFILERASQ